MIDDEEKPDNASLWTMRLTLLLIGVLFVIVGSLAPEDVAAGPAKKLPPLVDHA